MAHHTDLFQLQVPFAARQQQNTTTTTTTTTVTTDGCCQSVDNLVPSIPLPHTVAIAKSECVATTPRPPDVIYHNEVIRNQPLEEIDGQMLLPTNRGKRCGVRVTHKTTVAVVPRCVPAAVNVVVAPFEQTPTPAIEELHQP